MLLVGNRKVCLNLNLFHYMLLSYHKIIKYLGYEIGIQFNNSPLVVEQTIMGSKL